MNVPAYSTYVELKGVVQDGVVTYRVYLGANATTDFNVVRNTNYNISVNIKGNNELDTRVELEEFGETSNCYIVSPNATVVIPVSRANEFKANAIADGIPLMAEIIWSETANDDDFKQIKSPDASIADIRVLGRGPSGCILVKAGNQEGNAVIAVKVGPGIVWSWHVWVTELDPMANSIQLDGYTYMDRSLGATNVNGVLPHSEKSYGLFYQWGRKDPFPRRTSINTSTPAYFYTPTGKYDLLSRGNSFVNSSAASTVLQSVQSPLRYYGNASGEWCDEVEVGLWSTFKTIYDPCPAGWRVPSFEELHDPLVNNQTELHRPDDTGWDDTNKGYYSNTLGWWIFNGSYVYQSSIYTLQLTDRTGNYWAHGNIGMCVVIDKGSSFRGASISWLQVNSSVGKNVRCILDE